MKYKVGDLVRYNWDNPEREFLGIVTKAWEEAFVNMYFVYFFDEKATYGYCEDALCLVSTK